MDKKYEICTYNTFTKRMEKVAVSKEVYTAYKRSGWNIKDNNQSFYDHEIQMSALNGGQNGAYENFNEFITDKDDIANEITKAILIKKIMSNLKNLKQEERELVKMIYFDGKTERACAAEFGISCKNIHKKKVRILYKLNKLLENEKI